jgi:hypothetical protein
MRFHKQLNVYTLDSPLKCLSSGIIKKENFVKVDEKFRELLGGGAIVLVNRTRVTQLGG